MTRQRIYLVEASTQYTLTSTFLRFQEHYESPKFRGKIFSLEEFMDWYAMKFGNFTYCQDWSGFNIPSSILKPFREGKFDPLSAKEKRLLKLFEKIQKPFYVIGSSNHLICRHSNMNLSMVFSTPTRPTGIGCSVKSKPSILGHSKRP